MIHRIRYSCLSLLVSFALPNFAAHSKDQSITNSSPAVPIYLLYSPQRLANRSFDGRRIILPAINGWSINLVYLSRDCKLIAAYLNKRTGDLRRPVNPTDKLEFGTLLLNTENGSQTVIEGEHFLCFSSDNKWMLTRGQKSENKQHPDIIHVWDCQKHSCVGVLTNLENFQDISMKGFVIDLRQAPLQPEGVSLMVSPALFIWAAKADVDRFIRKTFNRDSILVQIDCLTKKEKKQITVHALGNIGNISAACFSPDGSLIAIHVASPNIGYLYGAAARELIAGKQNEEFDMVEGERIYNSQTGKLIATISTEDDWADFSEDNKFLAIYGKSLKVFDIDEKKLLWEKPMASYSPSKLNPMYSLVCISHNHLAVVRDTTYDLSSRSLSTPFKTYVQVYEVSSGNLLCQYNAQRVDSIGLTGDGRQLFIAGWSEHSSGYNIYELPK